MMFTLLTGFHPLYLKGMSNDEYLLKLKANKVEFPPAFPE